VGVTTALEDLPDELDVLVMGSGAAGLVTACLAGEAGLSVAVLEKAALLGGTSAAGGGVMWAPDNPLMPAAGYADTPERAGTYLAAVTKGAMPEREIDWYLSTSAELVRWLDQQTRVRYRPLGRPDYHQGAAGAAMGRGLDNEPFDTGVVPGLADVVRPPTYFPLLTMRERDELAGGSVDPELPASRARTGVRTMGGALVAALVASALDRGVALVADAPVTGARRRAGRWEVEVGDSRLVVSTNLVIASGGFERDPDLAATHLSFPVAAIGAPSNTGDGLRLGLSLGADVADMSSIWGVPVVGDPDERYDGAPTGRMGNVEMTLPGSITVNRAGQRFVNEALNYHDLTRAFGRREGGVHVNLPAWLVFDSRFLRRYPVAGSAPGVRTPWLKSAPTVRGLAEALEVDPDGLEATVALFNADAATGVDRQFGRGSTPEDRHLGDPAAGVNPCLAPLTEPPFHAIEVRPGALGTAGGLKVDHAGRVLDRTWRPIVGLYAAGNCSATVFHDAYPGGGATLGSAMTRAFAAAQAITKEFV
jgi:3-oxosteroid 1-dehydrogenase